MTSSVAMACVLPHDGSKFGGTLGIGVKSASRYPIETKKDLDNRFDLIYLGWA